MRRQRANPQGNEILRCLRAQMGRPLGRPMNSLRSVATLGSPRSLQGALEGRRMGRRLVATPMGTGTSISLGHAVAGAPRIIPRSFLCLGCGGPVRQCHGSTGARAAYEETGRNWRRVGATGTTRPEEVSFICMRGGARHPRAYQPAERSATGGIGSSNSGC